LKFGLFGGASASDSTSPVAGHRACSSAAGYQPLVTSVVRAEALGYRSVFLVEHHFTGSAQISASLNVLTYLAARTSDIRLGTAVVVLPWHNPVLLAEQVATLDVLSGGRLDLGVGRGYRPQEFQHFNVMMTEAEERFVESVELLRHALSSDTRFSHRTARWQFDDIIVEPAPLQRPHPPLWVAAGRPESLRSAANNGFNLLLDQFATFDVALQRQATYRACVETNGQIFAAESVALARAVHVVRTATEREHAIQRRMQTLVQMNRLASGTDGNAQSSMRSDPDARHAAEHGSLIGTADEIIAQIRHLQSGGLEYLLLAGLMTDDVQLERFATEVMPAFS
jgi:alkanesulfonate monooxygenase SsuD/methylene tetrahydromethanopterin reductase-like flavin-dependent oxidoreductase (luciferase family)